MTAMANKNPAARAEALLFMARSFQLCTPDMLSKPFLKAICPVIITVSFSMYVHMYISTFTHLMYVRMYVDCIC